MRGSLPSDLVGQLVPLAQFYPEKQKKLSVQRGSVYIKHEFLFTTVMWRTKVNNVNVT